MAAPTLEAEVEEVPVSRVVPGMIVQLTGWQRLWDTAANPWREYSPPARFRVLQVTPLATGALPDQTPYLLVVQADDGAHIDLEVADGDERVAVVHGP